MCNYLKGPRSSKEIEVDGFSKGVKLDPIISYGLQKAPFEDFIY